MLSTLLILLCAVKCLVGKDFMGNGINANDRSAPPNIIFIMADDLVSIISRPRPSNFVKKNYLSLLLSQFFKNILNPILICTSFLWSWKIGQSYPIISRIGSLTYQPKELLLTPIKRIFLYLKGTKTWKLTSSWFWVKVKSLSSPVRILTS